MYLGLAAALAAWYNNLRMAFFFVNIHRCSIANTICDMEVWE